ncbi:NUDIX domain-containing protein [Nocardioides panaciterrulae]|uniref:ADP-ribose pyrophosphatase YjhB (NUDIX family) n=1 Tax=Nocardioides panaciterrulae TaxID=661492 RepID=A0A7Y9E5U1_9ACTN|nr:NUDIX hydrolase [Nocardioides panaciterrulae]NYD41654.1 ADP-ribose pyrophosphatase YjhB (NUDIX family) [Nocardioides panaciterrulae]
MLRFGCVILVDRRGWLLLQERDEHPAIDPEKWSLCGGHLEEGEEYAEGASRELAEETGVQLAPHELELFCELDLRPFGRDSHDVMAVYAAATELTDDDIVLGEGRQIVFVEPGAARCLDLSPSAAAVVPDFLDSDHYRRLCR